MRWVLPNTVRKVVLQLPNGHKIYLRNKLTEYVEGESDLVKRASQYVAFYDDVPDEELRLAFAMFHVQLNQLFAYLNSRIQNGHYTAHESRKLLYWMDEIHQMQTNLSNTESDFQILADYQKVIRICESFLQRSGGSPIPNGVERITLIQAAPIFQLKTMAVVERNGRRSFFPTTPVGSGSYASVHKYYDAHYQRFFAIKRANKDLTATEIERFRKEFDTMKSLNSPYVIEVYNFNEEHHEYTLEYADTTLKEYITTNNNRLNIAERGSLVRQVFRAFDYIHRKGFLHRDISTNNVSLKNYDGLIIVKVSDFGLVKLPDSMLTRPDTEMKGHLNDPKLADVGFNQYKMHHETYALVRLVYFIMTGRSQTSGFTNPAYRAFVTKGLSDNMDDRYNGVKDTQLAFETMFQRLSAQP